ncbi:LipA and NB-ARC [Aspergillus sp. HF37]|nr:LipA and NB-ARC [Aspergillus sp. HF37]
MSDPKPTKVNNIGLTEIYRSSDQPAVDIVFIHGLNGHPYNSWASQNLFWPVDLLPDILGPKRVRVLTYGYDANVHAFTDGASNDRIHNHAETLASKLAANRNLRECSDRPIIFVCHSLGGLVVKRALIHCKNVSSEKIEHLRSVYVSTYGILFLGTPHNGSDIARWGTLLQNICSAVLPKKFLETSPHLVKALRTNNETLQNINSLFAEVMGRFHIYFFHESRSTDVRGSRELIVDESSAAPYVEGVERMGIDADHSTMCKFDSENAPGYEAVAEALLRYSRDCPATISARWQEEINQRALMRKTKAQEIFDSGPSWTMPRDILSTTTGSVGYPTGGSAPDLRLTGNLPASRSLDEGASPSSDMAHSADLSSSRRSESKPLFVVPLGFHPNSTFVGMKKELESLHALLFKENKRAERLMAVLISGPPGSGKSHLAREYVWTRRDSYPGGIFWIDAKSTQSICNCFWDIAQAATLFDGHNLGNAEPQTKSPHEYVDAVREWLQSREEWLLVFDGLHFVQNDDLNEFRQFLPFNKRCSIVYTSVDKTMRRKQRLFEPYGLKIAPLKVADACKLLFKDLGIRKPTADQVRKATELVKYYECLPLAIHAISHRLSSTSKPIEKYHIHSHLTDEKLAEPFLGIMGDLYETQHFEALNLINIMSFLGHRIPVGLINLGKAALEMWDVQILTPSRPGAHGDIDTTLGILIRCGLIERVTDTYTVHPKNERSDNDSFDMKAVTPEMSESQTESSQEASFASSSSPAARTIDVIKIHGVVQGFCRDELKIMDEEQQQKTLAPATGTGYYDSWLLVATRVLCKSFESATAKTVHCVSAKDYREYETHASRLLDYFPKKTSSASAPQMIRQTREELRQLVDNIGNEITRASLSSSYSSQKQRSVFDRSSGSSSSGPDSSTDEGPGPRQLTWDWNDTVCLDHSAPEVESPEEIAVPPLHSFSLAPFPPHIYRESSLGKELGYETDSEGHRAVLRTSPAISQTTEKPKSSPASSPPQVEDSGSEWHLVEKQSKPKKKARDFRKPRAAAPMLNVFQATGKSVSNHELGDSRRSSIASSEAEKALTAVHKASPPPSNKFGKENAPMHATIAESEQSSLPGGRIHRLSAALQGKSSGESLESRATKPQASYLSSELKPDQLSHSVFSEAYYGPDRPQLNVMDTNTAPGTRYHSRNPSSMGNPEAIGDMTASAPGLVYCPPPVPYEEDIPISVSQRRFGSPLMTAPINQPVPGSANTHPSAYMPGSSPPCSYSPDPPRGSASDPAMSEPMSRGPSGQSNQSWSTEPARYPPRISPMPSNLGKTQAPQFGPQQHLVYGTGGWTEDVQAGVGVGGGGGGVASLHPETAHKGPGPTRFRRNSLEEQLGLLYGQSPSPETPHLGRSMVDVRSARERLVGHNRYPPPSQTPYGALATHEMPIPPEDRGARSRRGSSAAKPGYRIN